MPEPVNAVLIGELFDRYAAALEFYARQRTTSPADCVQEAFMELARLNDAPADPVAWLFRVVRHRSLNAARSAQRRAVHEQTAAARKALRQPISSPLDAAALEDLMQLLNDERREIVVLRIWGRLTWEEIAEVTSSSRSSAHRSFVQALEQLKQHLEPVKCAVKTQADRR